MLLSVIVPVYNAEKYLPRCLDSLLNQGLSEDEMEILCVDDGSTDGSTEILREYECMHPCVKMYVQENAGAGAARNVGLVHACGDVITFCDADDYLIPLALGFVLRTFWNEEVDVICHGSTTLDAKKLKTWKEDNDVKGEILCKGDGRMVYERDPKYFVWNTLIRRGFIEQHHLRFPLLRMTEDSCFMLELMMLRPRCIDISSNIYRYTESKGQITRNRDPEEMRRFVQDYLHFLTRLHDFGLKRVIEFQKRPFYSRMLSADLNRSEYSVWSGKVTALSISMPPYPCYKISSLLFRKLFLPYILPRLSRG